VGSVQSFPPFLRFLHFLSSVGQVSADLMTLNGFSFSLANFFYGLF